MTGKEKCEFLKEIRKTMAEKNGITYVPRKCHHEGDCAGTCPLCDKEAAQLLAELKKKENNGEKIQIDSEVIQVIEQIAERPEEIDNEEEEIELLGDIPAGYFDHHALTDEEKRLEIERFIREVRERDAMEALSEKEGFWRRIKHKIRHFIAPYPPGIIDDEDEIEKMVNDEEPLMGMIASDDWLRKEPKSDNSPEHEPDIIWNMDDKETTIITPSANIVNNENENE
jgi:hypothetical protein